MRIVIGVLVVMLIMMLPRGYRQEICVADPIVPMSTKQDREPLRQKVEGWVREKGFQVNCDTAQIELVVEPLSGVGESDQTYFVASIARDRDSAVGIVSTRPVEVSYDSWMVTIYQRGHELEGAYTLGHSLHGGVNKMLKKVKKASKYAEK